MRIIAICLMASFLAACATSQPVKTIPVSQYRAAAQEIFALGICDEVGLMDSGILEDGFTYIAGKHLGRQFSTAVLASAVREAYAKVERTEDDLLSLKHGNELSEEHMEVRAQFQGFCAQMAQEIDAEGQKRRAIARQNSRQRQESLSSMGEQLGNMGKMMMEGGNNALKASKPPASTHQPDTSAPSSGYNHSLINSPGGLRQRHCTQTSTNTQYCFE